MSHLSKHSTVVAVNRFYTIPQAARKLGIPSYKLRRAVKLGIIKGHRLLDGRIYVHLEEILEVMSGRATVCPEQASFDFTGSEGGSR